MKRIRDKTIALAAVFLAADIVNRIATRGEADQTEVETLLKSLFIQNPDAAEDVYGSVAFLRPGLIVMLEYLENTDNKRDLNIMRYVISMLHLERKLAKQKKMLDIIDKGIQRAQQQQSHFELTHSNILANLAGIYSETISQISPKIMVAGDNQILSNQSNTDKIRAILLSGVRACVLWSQVGGRRLQLLFNRKRFVQMGRQLLDEATPSTLH